MPLARANPNSGEQLTALAQRYLDKSPPRVPTEPQRPVIQQQQQQQHQHQHQVQPKGGDKD
jgi:hypothetical protein